LCQPVPYTCPVYGQGVVLPQPKPAGLGTSAWAAGILSCLVKRAGQRLELLFDTLRAPEDDEVLGHMPVALLTGGEGVRLELLAFARSLEDHLIHSQADKGAAAVEV
jgi:hypothetical protein